MSQTPPQTGAHLIASSLVDLGVDVIFGIVGIPVIEVAEACIAAGIRFISFRNEQAASYAASAYGYMTGKPGVCLVVGGPGVLHAMAGIGNSQINATFPLLLLAGAAPTTDSATKLSFQQLDQVSLLAPHTKLSLRPASLSQIPTTIRDAYRASFYGRPGATYVDLPADYIQTPLGDACLGSNACVAAVEAPPKVLADPTRISAIAAALKGARNPLIIIGKGAAYARAEDAVRGFVEETQIPFLPTPQGKGVIPDSHVLNTSAARSSALKGADFILLLGARVNWILHFGTRFAKGVKIAQVDIVAEELGRNGTDSGMSVVGDIDAVLSQLLPELRGYRHPESSSWRKMLQQTHERNLVKAKAKEQAVTRRGDRLSYQRVFRLIEDGLLAKAGSPDGLVYVSEGANTMDISRSIFSISSPRQRLDAGTYATMGVGLGYAIAASIAYPEKRVIAIEGDSALGFSLAEIETMARYRMPVVIVVMNNGGVYHGISDNTDSYGGEWEKDSRRQQGRLPSTALGFETEYHKVAEGLGARGHRVTDEEGLRKAVEAAWEYKEGPTLINVVIKSGAGGALSFGWLEKKEEGGKAKL
ncbi:thiamine pyrophosphate enzyme, N-terminal TPP binding domain-containing protein [Pyronema domesticum]|uniref:2-hydroxyacyl-CoA lyase n=1 Tax=Pyronema omphalodes (strain CBS 100304) TaxID=1076935 RepID=U4L4N0_PYROM|nr:thiamine pyrophosphate enzyme, N-terminal TPP binding domain-containing protein [Pyronema domesticum]CCX10700.1 Similar to Putative 2-hydroxyacyl-CoA lyase; acc. no. Q9Y7M1 [Pyronema omphalodes CBS 100304]